MNDSASAERRWPGYNAVWRWHFYAGLFCIPFVLWLALTGSIYLFKPQIEILLDQPYAHVAGPGPRATAAAQAEAAVRAVPGSVLHRYQLPETADQAVQILVGDASGETRVYVHPRTLAILKTEDEGSRPMRVVFRLHGELLAGDPGSYAVELAASWAIVMILSGLFLWWPRGGRVAGVLYPRLRSGRMWRDLHAVTGFWVSFSALFMLLSGLPWATSWGSYLKAVRAVAEGSAVKPDWAIGAAPKNHGTKSMMGEHAEHQGMTMAHPAISLEPLDRLIATIRPLELAAPVLIAPPTAPDQPWTAKSDAANRPLRTDLGLDGASGQILTRKDFAERRLIDRIVGYGIAVHEGQLFGLANQLLNLATAIGLVLLSVSSIMLWWRRKPGGALGAPPVLGGPPVAMGFVALLVALGLLLPLFGVTMAAVLLVERLVLRRLPATRRWLGLEPVQQNQVAADADA